MGKKSGILLELAAATIPILRGILVAFLFNGHALAIYYLWRWIGVGFGFRPECDVCVYMCCCLPAFTCPQDHQERRGEES